jgi:pilus assembly protein CpaC
MIAQKKTRQTKLALASAAAIAVSTITMMATAMPAHAQSSQRATAEFALSKGRGQLVNLPVAITDVLVSNDAVADVQVRSPRQIYILAKEEGESTVFATTRDGKVVYSANVRVAQNFNTIEQMLQATMPDANIRVTTLSGMIVLSGTVATPDDAAEAELLVNGYVGNKMDDAVKKTLVISRLRTATPLQVSLHVKIAEVNREVVKNIGVNLTSIDAKPGGFLFGVGQGRNIGTVSSTFDPVTGQTTLSRTFTALNPGLGTGLGFGGKFLGMNLLGALDLAETDGLAVTLAQPNLTALSGETASFLAGGEIPIPIREGTSNTVTIEYKQFGVSLAFTPTVLGDGRISMRVRPEVSQLSTTGSIQLNGFNVPALSTRRAETTVELGSGQSFMIAGLMQNSNNNLTTKAPGVGDVPILGALFRSNNFRRNETELVIVVTPYLVKPVSANEIALPTDGYKAATDAERVLLGQSFSGKSGEQGPAPRKGEAQTIPAPSIGADSGAESPVKRSRKSETEAAPAPGFGN